MLYGRIIKLKRERERVTTMSDRSRHTEDDSLAMTW